MELRHARILLTGATGGLGGALAEALVAEGATLLLAGRDRARLEAMAGRLRNAIPVQADLNSEEGIQAAAQAGQRFRVDILINNAGINDFSLFAEQDWGKTEQILATNLHAPMRLTQALLPHLQTCKEAMIVNIGSTFGSLPFPGFASYSVAKAGLRAFSQALRRELADGPVDVLHVSPRAIATALNSPAVNALNDELGSRSDRPEEVARRIVKSIRRHHRELHVGFPESLFAWINGLAPSVIDGALAKKLHIVKRHAPSR